MRAWLQLVRAPNLLTVPGDVLAGFALAAAGRSDIAAPLPWLSVLAGLCLYAAGLILNDLADIERDRRERPARPLPRGAISARAAMVAAGVLLSTALVALTFQGSAALLAGVVVGLLILLYNGYARRDRLAGALVMGVCRAGNMALGALALAPVAFPPHVAAAGAWWLLLVAAITWLAAREMRAGAYGPERWLPSVVVVAGAALTIVLTPAAPGPGVMRAGLGFLFAFVLCAQAGMMLGYAPRRPDPSVYPAAIGRLLSALLPMQAGLLVLVSDQPWAMSSAFLLLIAWPLHRGLARWFAPS